MGLIDHAENLLTSAEMKFEREDQVLNMSWKTDHFESLKLKIFANADESWLYIVAYFTNFYKVDEFLKYKLAIDMLKESYKANGVKFALDNDDDIIVLAETNDTDLTVAEIQTLINHVVSACDKLGEIYPS